MKKANHKISLIAMLVLILVSLIFCFIIYNNQIYAQKVINAIEQNNIDGLEELLKSPVGNLNSKPTLWLFDVMTENAELTPLQTACKKGELKIVKLLLENGADANYVHWDKSRSGDYPLMLAASSLSRERIEIIELLVEYGADINCENGIGNDALSCAVYASFDSEDTIDVIEYLEQKGANIHKKYSATQNTLLHKACEKDSFLIVEYLVAERNFDVNAQNADGDTPIIYFLRFASEREAETLMFLLQHGADPDIKNNEGKSAYDYAVEKHPEFLELF